MKTLAAGLQEHLDTGATTLCWCWKVIRIDGEALGFTDHDEDVVFDGVTYSAFTGFTASEITSSLGLSVDNLDVEGALSSDRIEEKDITAGVYDDAAIEIWRVNWQSTAQRSLARAGNFGEISRGETFFRAEVRGVAHKLQQPQGRIFQRTCDAQLGDEKCAVDLAQAAFRATVPVSVVQGSTTIGVGGLGSYDEGWFDRGVLKFNAGQNAGLSFAIRSHQKSSGAWLISTWEPVPFPVEIGDTVELTAGCDKRFETCRAKFANGLNFRGFPHMPGNDFVAQYANQDGDNLDGGQRVDTY